MDIHDAVNRAERLREIFPCLEYGQRVLGSGAAPIAYDIKLLRELLKRREAELYVRLYDSLVLDDEGWKNTRALATLTGVSPEEEENWHTPIIERLTNGLIADEDPRETVVNMVAEAIAFNPATATEEDEEGA